MKNTNKTDSSDPKQEKKNNIIYSNLNMSNQQKAELIIEKFIDQFQSKHKKDNIVVEGILLFGSYLNSDQISKNSDLDVYIVIKNNQKRYRGITHIDNVEVDYFINPIKQLRNDFNQNVKSSKKTIVFMLAGGKILKDKRHQLGKLQKEAINILRKEKKQKISAAAVIFTKYFIDDFLKDIQDNYEEKDYFALQYNINLLLNYLIESFCKNKGVLLVKPKYQKNKIKEIDSHFIELFEEVVMTENIGEKIKKITKLSDYVLNDLGGKLPDEWEIESVINL